MTARDESRPAGSPEVIDLTGGHQAAEVVDLSSRAHGRGQPWQVAAPSPWPYLRPVRSPRRSRIVAVSILVLGPAVGCAALALLASLRPATLGLPTSLVHPVALALSCVAFLLFVAGLAVGPLLRARPALDAGGGVLQAGEEEAAGPTSEALRRYQDLSLLHTGYSFRTSQAAMGAAFVFVVSGALAVILLRGQPQFGPTTQWIVAGLATVGSGLTTFLSRTFLRAHDSDVQQLNRTHAVTLATNLLDFASQLSRDGVSTETRDANIRALTDCAVKAVETTLAGSLSPPEGRRWFAGPGLRGGGDAGVS